MASFSITRALPALFGALLLAAPAAAQGVPRLDSYNGVAVRILQSNNAGNTHHIIDPVGSRSWASSRAVPRAQSDRPPRRALLLLLQRAGQGDRRVRHDDAAAGHADSVVGAAQ